MIEDQNKYEATSSFAEQWLSYRAQTVGAHEVLLFPEILRQLGNIRGMRLLDVGCGEGSFLQVLAVQEPAKLYGMEINQILLEKAKTKVAPDSPTELNVVQQDATTPWSLSPGSVDKIIASCLVMHLSNREVVAMLQEALNVLSPGGEIIIAKVHFDWARSQYHLHSVSDGSYIRVREQSSVSVTEYHRSTKVLEQLANRAGLELIDYVDVPIQDGSYLEERYRKEAGRNLFDVARLQAIR